MKRYIIFAFCILAFSCVDNDNQHDSTPDKTVIEDSKVELQYGIPVDDYDISMFTIKSGDLFGSIMDKAGVDQNTVNKLTDLSKGLFDVRKLRVGNEYEFFYKKQGDSIDQYPSFFVYEKDRSSHVVMRLSDSLFVNLVEKDIKITKKYATISIESSLWNDMNKAGIPAILACQLEDIFAWSIDFSGLQVGDSFDVLYDELSYEDEFVGVGNVYYTVATHNGKDYPAVRFEINNKGAMYWNESGESLKKAFLKAPLRFTRISSGFTYNRRHPVLKIVRPHTGVDYAAPSGTPVMSIGDGVVIQKGWTGGGGNTIKIKHNRTYTTSYMHLKSFAKGLAVGKRVSQGDVIGTVGSTGLSTGPHLDFRVYRNGKPINPLKMESPAAEPLDKQYMEEFKNVGRCYRGQIDSIRSDVHYKSFLNILKGQTTSL